MTPLPALLQQFAVRYRTALMARAGVLAGLGLASCGLLAWRLRALHVNAAWTFGLPAALAAVLLAGLGWWLRRQWLNRRRAAAFLDRTLGLQQQLVTAEEFAASPGVSSLYPVLVEDLGRQLSTDQVRFPRPWDHKTGLLLAVLLLLLLWPTLNAVLPPALRLPEPPQPQVTSGQRQARQQSQQQQSTAGSQQSAQSQDQQGGQGSQQPQPSGGGGEPQAGDQPSGQQDHQGGQGQQQPSAQGQGQAGQGADQQSTGGQQQSAAGDQPSAQNQAPQAAERRPSAQQQGSQGGQPQSAQAKGRQQQSSAQGRQSGGQQSQQAPSAREGQGSQGAGQSSGEGAALKADIQQLLKEMSGELKHLQAQLEQAKDQPQPAAGTGTDPNLYGASETMETAAADNPIPLQLETDTADAQRGRQGMGVGAPSGEVSDAAPAAEAQAAALSDQPLEESSVPRQPVPAEYRSVFDQLQRRESQPDEPKR